MSPTPDTTADNGGNFDPQQAATGRAAVAPRVTKQAPSMIGRGL